MRLLLGTIFFFIGINASFAQQNLSNKGKEFWVGYGHNQLFTGNSQEMILYLSAEQAANVTVRVNGTNWVRNYAIPANTAIQSDPMPKTGAQDSRMRTAGISSRGISIVSDVPIVVYAHCYGQTSSGATMLMPIETWGSNYTSLNSSQDWGSDAFSWAYVVAYRNNTVIQFTPAVDAQGGYAAGVTASITLNRGQTFNLMAVNQSDDMTGTTIKSVINSEGDCFPIGVFSGSSRTRFCSSGGGQAGGDFNMVQIFPASAWGTKYLCSPNVNAGSISNNTTTTYKIAVRDPSTVVRVNGLLLTGLVNNFYYEYVSATPPYFTADKPILVAQLFQSQSCSGSGNPQDPEMIYLSPVEQAIKKVVFYNTDKESGDIVNNTFVNVIVPNAGLASLLIDGANSFDRTYTHPNNNNYTVVIKRVSAPSQHSIESDSSFTAITYGFANFESYGYNAGTLINNLSIVPAIQNSFSNTSTNNFTCKNTPFRFKISLAYRPTNMKWLFSQVPNLTPAIDTIINNPIPFDSVIIGTRKFYSFQIDSTYSFSDTGNYRIPIQISSPEIDNCSNTDTLSFFVLVKPGPIPNFSFTTTGCRTDTVFFNGSFVSNGFNVTKYRWSYLNSVFDSTINTAKVFQNTSAPAVKFTVIADNGCFSDTTKIVPLSPAPIANFGINPLQRCPGVTVTYTDTSSFGGVPLNLWYWDLGNGTVLNNSTNAPVSATYPSHGLYTIKHFARVLNGAGGGCASDTAIKILRVFANPVPTFNFTQGCLPDSIGSFYNTSSVPDSQVLRYSWNFGDPNANANNPNTDTARNPTHKYTATGTYPVTLTVTTAHGCSQQITRPFFVQGFASRVDYTIRLRDSLCAQNQVRFVNQMQNARDSVYRVDIWWDFGNSPNLVTTDNAPTQNEIYTNTYPNFTTPNDRQVIVKWLVFLRGGCTTEKLDTITLRATPQLSFPPIAGGCVNGNPFSVANATLVNLAVGTGIYSGPGTSTTGVFNPSQAGAGVHVIKYFYTSTFGCVDSASQNVRVFPKPIAKFGRDRDVCLQDSIRFRDSSSTGFGALTTWNWNFGDGSTASNNNNNSFFKTYSNYGTYNVTLQVVSDSGCVSDTFRKTVLVDAIPFADFDLPNSVCMPNGMANFTNRTTIASGTPSSMTYSWTFGDGGTSNVLSPSHTYTQYGPFNIRLLATSTAGCVKDTTKALVNFYTKPVARFLYQAVPTYCPNKNILFLDTSIANATSISKYYWDFGDGTKDSARLPIKRYADSGLFTIKYVVQNVDGCFSDTATNTIRIFPQPKVDAGPDFLVREFNSVQLQPIVNAGNFTYLWTPSRYLNNDTAIRPISTPEFNQVYKLTVTGIGNCTAFDTMRVTVLKPLSVPNAFSPNGDGVNDVFAIPYLEDYPGAEVEIFNRYGQVVYRAIGYARPWDGKMNGEPLPVGVYYYVIKPKNNGYEFIKGSVTILR